MKTPIKDKPRYRRVSLAIWSDQRFRALSAPGPSAQHLWLWFLTGPSTQILPGVIRSGMAGIAETLRWPLPATRRCWDEIAAQGMAQADWDVLLIWLPKAIEHNQPESPNVVTSWRNAFNELPECAMRLRIEQHIVQLLEDMGASWVDAWHGAPDDPAYEARVRRWLRKNPEMRAAIKARDGDRCRYCGSLVSWVDRRGPHAGTYDHVAPKGPSDLSNIVTACRSCNSKKGRQTSAQAGMVPLPALGPGLDLGPNPDTEPGPTWNQDQEQEQEIETPPSPPVPGGRPFTRLELTQAKEDLAAYRDAQPRYVAPVHREAGREYPEPRRCPHEPQCDDAAVCLALFAQDRRDRVALRLAERTAS